MAAAETESIVGTPFFRHRLAQAAKEAWWRGVPSYLGMSTIAVAQPMLDLYGKNLPVFSTAKLSRYEIALFAFLVVVVPTVVSCGIEFVGRLISPRSGPWIRNSILGVFGSLFLLTVMRQLNVDSSVVVFALAISGGLGFVWLIMHKKWARTFVAYLAIAAPIVTGVFVINTWKLLFPEELPIAATNPSNTSDPTKPPIVLIVIDEAPLYALVDGNGNINKERFPNFAQLSQEATWHRNATAVSNWTAQAVPAIFTSVLPKQGDLPLASVHPKNIFTALADTYPLNVYEPITSLCPASLCKSVVTVGERWNTERFRNFLNDSLVVFGHRTLPKTFRDNIPSIDEGWGGFAGGNTTEPGDNENERMSQLRAFGVLGPMYQANLLRELTRRMSAATTPEAYIAHLLVPHRPWQATPDERVYETQTADVPDDVVPSDLDQRRTMYQRYLMQMAMVDTMLGNMINEMKRAKTWDSSIVVIAADHGLTFEPDAKVRQAQFESKEITDDLYRVPMFVKLPQQKTGGVTDCTVSVLDILPTILSVADLNTGWIFDGRDVSSLCPSDASRVITSTKQRGSFTNAIEMLFERSQGYDSLVTRNGGADTIAAVGASGKLIGQRVIVNENDSGVKSWTVNELAQFDNISERRGARIPTQIRGTISLQQQMPDTAEGIITIDGVAAGVVTEIAGASGKISFDAILSYQLLTEGAHNVGLLINYDGNGTDIRTAPAVTR